MSSIARYRETLQRWGLSDVPFRATPLEDLDGRLLPSALVPDEEERSG